MAIPKGMASIARHSGVARALLDIAEDQGLEPSVVRTTSTHGYLVPEAVAAEYEKMLKGGKGKKSTAKGSTRKAKSEDKVEGSESASADEVKGSDKETKSDEKTVSPKAAAEKE